ncbi:MAG: alkaline shock response membrane anchor protein AmaP [Actinomycetota bacterium]|nr:alkaline shock response membrane anchor protein AmaP [Actinomycetota bacterium]
MNPNRPARLNRTVLAILGVLVLAAGAFVLLIGTGILRRLVPISADAPLIARNVSPQPWVPWAVTAAAIIVVLLSLRWLVAQAIRQPPSSDWQLAPDTSTGTTYINSDAAAEPLGEEIADYSDVHSATARLTGARQHPHLYLRVLTNDRADITQLRHRIDAEAIPRLAQALNLPALSANLLLQLDASSGPRTR